MSSVKASNETSNIQAAEASINQAFTNVLSAEKAGGNVTLLIAKLNSAGALLAEADNFNTTGNSDNITSMVDNARLIANQVNSDALALRNSSITQAQNNMILTILFSFMSIVAFIILMLLIWSRFKRRFVRNFLNSKPVVAENAA